MLEPEPLFPPRLVDSLLFDFIMTSPDFSLHSADHSVYTSVVRIMRS